MIMDGVGIGKNSKLNALKSANTEYLDNLILEAKAKQLYTELNAHGTFVGLPSVIMPSELEESLNRDQQ
ncbi:MAG: hypothetical protein P8Y23_07080 [Candidatus Lokiarchaeota archaeon]